jgi:alpha-D-xyloside xylohydrolase
MNARCAGVILSMSLAAAIGATQPAPRPDAVQGYKADAGAALITLADGVLRIAPCEHSMVRISYAPASQIPDLSNLYITEKACVPAVFTVVDTAKEIEVQAAGIHVSVNRNSGAVSFEDKEHNKLLSESDWPFPRSVSSGGAEGSRASVWFALTPEDKLYGLGQHQHGLLNQRGLQMELSQDNTNISIPFFLSSKGYGVLWNNSSVTEWNNRFLPVLKISSSVSEAVDYYFIYGPEFDQIVAGYRQLTGAPPIFPRWAYGYWQSKLAYASQSELLTVAAKYRSLNIPLDNMILDAGWETNGFGSRIFNPRFPDPRGMIQQLHDEHVHLMVSVWPLFTPGSANYDEMLKQDGFLNSGKYSIPAYTAGSRLYDAFNAQARKTYWAQIQKSLLDLGVDAFWMDSTEPGDLYAEERGSMLEGAKTALGDGSRFENMYPLMTTKAIYEGQRNVTDRKRVFILSRSAFVGMQKNAAAVWSGDTAADFETLKRQIPAGLNYSMSGLPYWTTDIGGFTGGDPNDPAYRDLFVRWFEFGSMCPIFRVHGFRKTNENELWAYGPRAQKILTFYDRLHYRLLPYIYSNAAQTTFDGFTPMRALAFDFRQDPQALEIGDEFMYGRSLLVAPVTDAASQQRRVYLPKGATWYDFWTGTRIKGGQRTIKAAPLSVMPLYIRAGSILPLGPEEEYSDQHSSGPLEVRIYAGADGDLNLYDDDGASYDYEKGAHARIAMHWDDKTKVLKIGAREGSFEGMQNRCVLHFILVRPAHGVGEHTGTWDRSVVYTGEPLKVQM